MDSQAEIEELRAEIDRLRDLCAHAESAAGTAEAEVTALEAKVAALATERDEAVHARNLAAAVAPAPSTPGAGLVGRLRSKLSK